MKLLNNKDLKLALTDVREFCPNEEVKKVLSKDNVMLIDIFYGNTGIQNILKKSLIGMDTWTDDVAKNVKEIFTKYIKGEHETIN